ncbi:uncharacterized protein LOC134753781 [Cydia strobilella]|uniref:uncharacterized protein LOC134753781 n=1 Tax=Cydia strobilella TaxID=1100964 RepID=UPI003005A541
MSIGLNEMSDRARAYPAGDAQGQHPAPVGNGQGLSHQPGRGRRKKRAREPKYVRLRKSDRIIAMKVMLENVTLNLISVYAPQSGCDDVAKEKFWEDFDAVTMTIPANEEIYVGGDFNGHVGRMNVGTERPPAKIRWHMLEKNECAIKFKERVIDKMIEMNGMEGLNANECWNEMANYIRRVAKDVLGESKGKGVIDKETWWWNEEVQGVLKKKKQAFKEWQSVETGQEVEKEIKRTEYIECKKKAKRAVAIARTAAQDNLYESLNSPKGEKQLYRLAKARERSSRDMAHIKCVKDDAGKVITKDEAIKERWKVYFERLMNEENEWGRVLEHRLINMGAVKEICMDEVRTAVRSMKNGKSVGPDDIPGEVWKLLREDGCMWLTLFFNKLLHEETIPDEWY